MINNPLIKPLSLLPISLTLAAFAPKLILQGGVIGVVAGIIFFSWFLMLFVYTCKLYKKINTVIKEDNNLNNQL